MRAIAAAIGVFTVSTLGFGLVGMASAVDAYQPPPPPPTFVDTALDIDLAFGLALTSNYISRGITQTGNLPAIQGYIEPSIGGFYLNLWSSNVNFGPGFEGAELDVGLGYRWEWNNASFDVGWVHYFYAPLAVSPAYGELYGKLEYNFEDILTFGGKVYYAPDFSQSGFSATYTEATLEIPIPAIEGLSVSGGVGYQFFENPAAFEDLTWNAGITYNWEAVTFDLRYSDTDLTGPECLARSGFSNGCGPTIYGTVSVDSDFDTLREMFK
jgi:uncharacterized protein (TIGR02001 family)